MDDDVGPRVEHAPFVKAGGLPAETAWDEASRTAQPLSGAAGPQWYFRFDASHIGEAERWFDLTAPSPTPANQEAGPGNPVGRPGQPRWPARATPLAGPGNPVGRPGQPRWPASASHPRAPSRALVFVLHLTT